MLSLVLSMLAVSGCKRIAVGYFGDAAFYHLRGHYRVRYLPGEPMRLLPAGWELDNFATDGEGRPTVALLHERFWTDLSIETDVNRKVPARAEAVDLRFVHQRDGAVIFTRTLPLPSTADGRDLQVLARDFVDRTSGGSYSLVSVLGEPAVREQRFAPRVLREGPATVNGQPAYYTRFELVDVDRAQAAGGAPGEMLTLVFIRPGNHVWRSGVDSRLELPMVLVAGLASRPERHDEHRDAFAAFVSRIDVNLNQLN